MQSALVKVVVVKTWRLLGAGPPVMAVPPHPVTTAETPPAVAAEAMAIGRTLAVKVKGSETSTTPTLHKNYPSKFCIKFPCSTHSKAIKAEL